MFKIYSKSNICYICFTTNQLASHSLHFGPFALPFLSNVRSAQSFFARLSTNCSLVDLGDKIVYHRGPAPVILKISDVSARLLIQVVEQVPGILRDDKDLELLSEARQNSRPAGD